MAEFPALPLFTDAITADCGHLTDEEFGRYVRILILMWRSPACRIPADVHWICKRLRVDALAYAQHLQPILQEFCTVDAGHWVQKRLLKEYQYVQALTEKRRKAAASRWEGHKPVDNKRKSNMQVHMQSTSKSDAPTPTPTPTILDTNVSNAAALSSVEIDMMFQTVWNAYPGRGKDGAKGNGFKGSKAQAAAVFTKIIKATKKDEHENLCRSIQDGAEKYAGHLDRSGYPSKHASTWLNQRGWEDDYGSSGPTTTRPGGKHERARNILAGNDPDFIEG